MVAVGDVVRVVNPSADFLEAVFVDNVMDYGKIRVQAMVDKLSDPTRKWKVIEVNEELASISGLGFRCEVPSMIEIESLEKI